MNSNKESDAFWPRDAFLDYLNGLAHVCQIPANENTFRFMNRYAISSEIVQRGEWDADYAGMFDADDMMLRTGDG